MFIAGSMLLRKGTQFSLQHLLVVTKTFDVHCNARSLLEKNMQHALQYQLFWLRPLIFIALSAVLPKLLKTIQDNPKQKYKTYVWEASRTYKQNVNFGPRIYRKLIDCDRKCLHVNFICFFKSFLQLSANVHVQVFYKLSVKLNNLTRTDLYDTCRVMGFALWPRVAQRMGPYR